MGLFDAMNVSATGLTAQRYRMDIIAENVANANSTRTEGGGIYRRKVVTFEAEGNSKQGSFSSMLASSAGSLGNAIGGGVRITSVREDRTTDIRRVYDPSHPDADEAGYVYYPNVDTITEMTNLIDATRAYEANATAIDASKSMMSQALNIGK